MMRGFEERIKDAEAFQTELFSTLNDMGFTVAVNGTEHTHPKFVEALRQSTDPTSLAIRFQPDGVAAIGGIPRSLYVEAKNAKNIERTAYEQYMRLYEMGSVVVVVFGKLNWGWNFIESIGLIHGDITTAPFPPHKRLPVNDGWIMPRDSERWNKIRGSNHQASGTPYREVDPNSLETWPAFKLLIIGRLAGIALVSPNIVSSVWVTTHL